MKEDAERSMENKKEMEKLDSTARPQNEQYDKAMNIDLPVLKKEGPIKLKESGAMNIDLPKILLDIKDLLCINNGILAEMLAKMDAPEEIELMDGEDLEELQKQVEQEIEDSLEGMEKNCETCEYQSGADEDACVGCDWTDPAKSNWKLRTEEKANA